MEDGAPMFSWSSLPLLLQTVLEFMVDIGLGRTNWKMTRLFLTMKHLGQPMVPSCGHYSHARVAFHQEEDMRVRSSASAACEGEDVTPSMADPWSAARMRQWDELAAGDREEGGGVAAAADKGGGEGGLQRLWGSRRKGVKGLCGGG